MSYRYVTLYGHYLFFYFAVTPYRTIPDLTGLLSPGLPSSKFFLPALK